MIASVLLNLLKSCSVLQPLCRAPDRKLRYAEFAKAIFVLQIRDCFYRTVRTVRIKTKYYSTKV